MRILITGGSGFIGSHIAEHFHKQAEVVVLDNLRTGNIHNLSGLKLTFVKGCITDSKVLEKAMEGVHYVFHLAALVSVAESMANPLECARINTLGHIKVLEAAAKAGVRKLVFASSAAIYGDNPIVPKLETMPPEPRSPYAMSKLDGEFYNALFTRKCGLETANIRFFNVFGPRQNPLGGYAAAVPIFIERALNRQLITIYGDGEQTRDFIYVEDIVSALIFAATTPGLTGTYNAGYGQKTSINELGEMISKSAGTTFKREYLAERPGDVPHSLADASKLRTAGWQPKHDLRTGLSLTIEYARMYGRLWKASKHSPSK
ncbi:MAG: NAD-dependent epimerase/dehydratase family protein [Puniceicoccales bacterium]|jgi:UDP-glucose 4-epimerase|nr:NAD-dependent epimerase/dehydratase family protein [Puniceicoccales bacterium]